MSVVGVKIRLARKPVCCKGICIIAMAKEPYAGDSYAQAAASIVPG